MRIHGGAIEMITMSEIAKLTHVSQPTVSRVLNGNKNVAPEIRERVLACAKEHDYQFNALAKGLQGSKTQLLGVLLTDISNSFFADLAKQIELEARKRGYSIILFNSDYDMEKEREYMDVVRRYRVDGVLAVPIQENSTAWMECTKKLDVPVVVVTRKTQAQDCVYVDHVEAGEMVALHLAQREYERFLFIGRSYDSKYVGFRQGLDHLGIDLTHSVHSIEFLDDRQLQQDLKQFLSAQEQRVGIFAYNDICALHVFEALRELNIAVPRQCGVIGFDNTFMGEYMNPKLSSMSQPIDRMAEVAVSRLTSLIDHPEPQAVLDQPLQADLVVRAST